MSTGADLGGADVWGDRRSYVLEETIGAPPDPLGPLGQNWGLPPPDPQAMLDTDGGAFAELLATNMAHAKALRLDHVMAMLRLFRIPVGKTPADGAYVAYPFDDLLAIARAASHRFSCAVVGEDLGNVPDGFRDRMERERILSYRLLLFERDDGGNFFAPDAYPRLSLVTATTHDLPTLLGWALGRDIDARERIGALDAGLAAMARDERRLDVSRLLDALLAHGALDRAGFDGLTRALGDGRSGAEAYDALVFAAYVFLADTDATLLLVQLDDVVREIDQINLPGTSDEYPNWRRKSHLDIDAIAGDPWIAKLTSDVRARVKGIKSS